MNSHTLRKRLSIILDNKGLSYAEVERGSGLPRTTFRNFMSGLVKEPKIEIILSAAKFLEVDPSELFADNDPQEESSPILHSSEIAPNSINKNLALECIHLIFNLFNQKNLSPSFEIFISIFNKVYNFSADYSHGVLDKTFVEWCINSEIKDK